MPHELLLKSAKTFSSISSIDTRRRASSRAARVTCNDQLLRAALVLVQRLEGDLLAVFILDRKFSGFFEDLGGREFVLGLY